MFIMRSGTVAYTPAWLFWRIQIKLRSRLEKLGCRCLPGLLASAALVACSHTVRTSAPDPAGTGNAPPVLKAIAAIPVQGFSSCPLSPEDFSLLTDIAAGRLVPNTDSSREGRIPLSNPEMGAWQRVMFQMENEPVPLVIDPAAPRPVFVAVFDGTWNDRAAKDEPPTVPGRLSLELESMAANTRDLRVRYYHGVGTRVPWWLRLWEGMTGAGTRERAEQAMRDLQAFASRKGKVPHVYTIGFSRGAASARHFLNLADAVLRKDPAARDGSLDRARSFALLFDTVATGQTGHLNLGIPPSTAAAFHFVAARERRLSFPVVSLSPAKAKRDPGQHLLEVELPGAHSDLGGGYGAGLEELSLVIASDVLRREGFVVAEHEVGWQARLNMGRHDSDWPGTAVANAISRRTDRAARRRVEPGPKQDAPADDTSTADYVLASMERSVREVAASQAELKRIQEAGRQGRLPSFAGLSIELRPQDKGLVLVTNCPKSVSFDLNSRWLLLDGRPYVALTEDAVTQAQAGSGLLMIMDRRDPADFKPAAPHEPDLSHTR